MTRNPAFTIVVMVTLALGLGANASVFSLLSRIFAEAPDGVSDARTLRRVYIAGRFSKNPEDFSDTYSYPQWVDFLSVLQNQIVTTYADDSAQVGDRNEALTMGVTFIDANYWRTLGVQPVLGRAFTPNEARIEVKSDVAIIGYQLWQQRFLGRPDVLGKTIAVSGKPYVIVAVAPANFHGTELSASQLWLPLGAMPMDEGEIGRFWFNVRGVPKLRVVMRVSSEQNETMVNARLTNAYRVGSVAGGYESDSSAIVRVGAVNPARGPMKSGRAVDVSTRLAMVSLLVLLIACANVGNLLLTRLLDRRQELAVRLALGGSRVRLATQMFVELLVLAMVSAIAALLAANWAGGILRALLMPGTRWADTVVDWRLVAIVLMAALLAAVMLAFVPFLHVRHFDGKDALKQGQRTLSNSGGRLRQVLIAGQTALAVVLLIGAGLCVRSLQKVMSVDVGYDVNAVAFAQPTLLGERGGESRTRPGELNAALVQEASRLSNIPGVQGVALASHPPIGGLSLVAMRIQGIDSVPKLGRYPPGLRSVSPEYWDVVGVKAVSGRLFGARDVAGAELVAVVNETMARVVWKGKSPLGQCLMLYGANVPCRTVVGVVRDAHWGNVIEKANMQFFVPLSQARKNGTAEGASTIVVRATPERLASVVANLSRSLNGALPNARINAQTLSGRLAPQYQPWRTSAMLFGVLGVLGLSVASVGLYGVIAYGVRRRRHELGIRSALGAERGRIVLMVLKQGATTAAIGCGVGVLLAIGLSRYVEALLYGTSPREPIVYASVLAVMSVTAVFASLVPAWQAGRVSPLTALRDE